MTEIDINRTHRLPTNKSPKGLLKVAVIGGNGFLGRHFVSKLAKKYTNLDIHTLDRNDKAIYIDTEGFRSTVNQVTMPVHVPGTIQPWLWANQPDIIIFMAGREGPSEGLNRPSLIAADLEAQVALTNTLEFMSDIRPSYFLYVSSHAVYGNHGKKFVSEESKLKPSNHVGQIRASSEQVVSQYCEAMGHRHCIVRPSEIFGRHTHKELSHPEYWPGYVSYFVNEAVTRIDHQLRNPEKDPEKFRFLFSPKTIKDFVHVDYVCNVLEHLCINREAGTYNISSGNLLSLDELVALTVDGIQKHPALPFEEFKSVRLSYDKKNVTKVSNSLVASEKIHSVVPYDAEKYAMTTFLENYLPIRVTEVRKQKDYEEAVLKTQVLDTTGNYRGNSSGN